MQSRSIMLVAACLTLAGALGAAPYYVAPGGDDAASGLRWDAAWATLSNAAAQAPDGSTVVVSNGTYDLTAALTINRSLIFTSQVPHEAVVNGAGSYRVRIFHPGAVMDGFTISNGYTIASDYGGGVYMTNGLLANCRVVNCNGGWGAGVGLLGDAVASNCWISANAAVYGGGGASIVGDGLMTDSVISNNSSYGANLTHGGGGVYMSGNGRLRDTLVVDNRAGKNGGGIIFYKGSPSVSNCDVAGNDLTNSVTTGLGGGGIYIYESTNGAVVDDCRIYGNSATNGGGVAVANSSGLLTNCLIYGNTAPGLGYGGGVYVRNTATQYVTRLHGCIISNNLATYGGGIQTSGAEVRGGEICWNTGKEGGGVFVALGLTQIEGASIAFNTQTTNGFSGGGTPGGGGITMYNENAELTLSNCTIEGNISLNNGAGLQARTGFKALNVERCLFLNNTNTAGAGAGAYLLYLNASNASNTFIKNSRFIGNFTVGHGGGIYTEGGVVQNCLFAGNSAGGSGGGVYLYNTATYTGLVENCTLAGNTAAVAGGGMYVLSTNMIVNTIVYSNLADTAINNDVGISYQNPTASTNSFHYCCTSRDLSTANQHNITNAPEFADFAGADYRLAAGSAGINAGTNEPWMAQGYDLDGRPRLDRITRIADMGCYEHVPRGTFFGIH